MKYITYSLNKYDPALFHPIYNSPSHNKPIGGLWASPLSDEYRTWFDFASNTFELKRNDPNFTFELKDDARILKIHTDADIDKLPIRKGIRGSIHDHIDFEFLAKQFDAMFVTRWSHDVERLYKPSFYGWDCDTLLVFNPECIINVENHNHHAHNYSNSEIKSYFESAGANVQFATCDRIATVGHHGGSLCRNV